ncbi:MAG: DUF3501 family protein [Proteobacteria bacterium]|nr:DUF3501 family protein [Pseudomonadota bacterium]
MEKITRQDLMPLEKYHEQRMDFRRTVMAHKAKRQIAIGPHATLYFEDRLTVQYQIQEMLRVERIFEAAAIEEELAAYNPLIPDGTNWKATFMLEYEDANERAVALEKLVGVEDRVWAQIDACERVWAIADEDLDRSRETKTAAVHFLRFEFPESMLEIVRSGSSVTFGIEHPHYAFTTGPIEALTNAALVADFA